MPQTKSHFRTTEVGCIPCPSGKLLFVTVKSPALSSRADLSIYVPKQAEGLDHVPVIILLHGVYGSHWSWACLAKAHLSLQQMIDSGEVPPMILAMPSDGLWGDGSAYLEHSGKSFDQWIVDDVPHAVSEVTGNPLDAPHFIGGLSMGGFGAMRLGALHPQRFRGFSGHSSITHLNQMPLFVEEPLDSFNPAGLEISVLDAILTTPEMLPPFRFDCGVDDPLIEHNRALAGQLASAGIAFTYQEFPGGHEWPYWEEHVRRTFRFFGNLVI
ncbi:MAG: alpha/beta hydrolase-fold protein [Akkermansiaceae bacterium]